MRLALLALVVLSVLAPCHLAAQTRMAPPLFAASSSPLPRQPSAPSISTAPGLFAPAWNQLEMAVRATHVTGDAARFQRFQDMRSGPLFTGARYAREIGGRAIQAGADNVGYRDQRYFGTLVQPGAWTLAAHWDEIPQFYSLDTRTPYLTNGAVLTLDDATQRAIQNGQANLTAYVPLATPFELREERNVGLLRFTATPTTSLDLTASFQTTGHSGELPFGASFGFANDVEVPLPYSSRTNDVNVGAEWSNGRRMLRVGYTGSWFENENDPLVWDNPLRLDDAAVGGPGRGRMSLWPTHTAHTLSASGYAKFAGRSQFTGLVSHGVWTNDGPLQPFTINAALPQLSLPRATSEAVVQVTSANLSLVSRPVNDWRLAARLRLYDFNNETTPLALPQMVSYDTAVRATPTGGPELFARNRATMSADATWTGTPVALTFGVQREDGSFDHRIFDATVENAFSVRADTVSTTWMTLRLAYEHATRTGDGLDEASLVAIGEQPALRHYDVANRTRNRFTTQVDLVPTEAITFSVSGGLGDDDYPDSYFGLQQARFRTFTTGVDMAGPGGMTFGGMYTYEHYFGAQRSRSATPGAQQVDPARDWTTDSRETVHYLSLYVTPPRIGPNTEVRGAYDWADARTRYVYGVVPGGPLPQPSQLPEVFNRLHQLRLEARHRLASRLSATFQYLYEPFDVYDFAFDSSVIDGIVQPSTLVMGYVYRPYRAQSAVAGLLYSW
ncbi:MAG TPA: MtrB/PioB family outer membrane beta-barrel protein [Vicinamibacterales bacterium]